MIESITVIDDPSRLPDATAAKLRVQRQDYYSMCDHPNERQCHAAYPDEAGHLHYRYFMWHLVDENGRPTDDGPWYSAREAREARAELAATPVPLQAKENDHV